MATEQPMKLPLRVEVTADWIYLVESDREAICGAGAEGDSEKLSQLATAINERAALLAVRDAAVVLLRELDGATISAAAVIACELLKDRIRAARQEPK